MGTDSPAPELYDNATRQRRHGKRNFAVIVGGNGDPAKLTRPRRLISSTVRSHSKRDEKDERLTQNPSSAATTMHPGHGAIAERNMWRTPFPHRQYQDWLSNRAK
jgi:hypothetical protein